MLDNLTDNHLAASTMTPDAIIWFSYKQDYPLLAHSVAAAKIVFPGAPLVVAIHETDRTEPEIEGVKVIRTSFPRGVNLMGPDCPLGVISAIGSVCRGGWAIKCDSDTIITRSDWCAGVASGTSAVAGWCHSRRAGFGAAYAISGDCADAVKQSIMDTGVIHPAEDRDIIGRARLWARWHGKGDDVREVFDHNPANRFRQYRPNVANDNEADALHYGMIPYDVAERAMAERVDALTRAAKHDSR